MEQDSCTNAIPRWGGDCSLIPAMMRLQLLWQQELCSLLLLLKSWDIEVISETGIAEGKGACHAEGLLYRIGRGQGYQSQ
jgi:hypothetical protein